MRLFLWLVRAALFFVLFAFAINNQHEVQLKWFFGLETRLPMVILVLALLGAGCLIGVLAMLPNWWRQRRRAHALRARQAQSVVPTPPTPTPAGDIVIPRDGL